MCSTMKLQHTTSLFAVFLFTTAVAGYGCAVSPPVEPGGDPGTAQVSSTEAELAAPPATTNACIAGGEPTGFAGRLCSRSDNNLPPHPNSVCCSGMAKWVCVVGEDLNEICWPRPRFTGDPEEEAALLACVPNGSGTGEQGGICNRGQVFPVQQDGLCCSGWARERCFARGEPSEMFCSPPPSLVSPEDTGAIPLACAPNGTDLGGNGICSGPSAMRLRTSRCCSGFALFRCPGEGEGASIVCVP